ncbi:putative LRR receptor-like serine/threonine-protein kinase [Cocos nucifera]|uniref:non-specific serine/threonine protein kinase n=1 Tax=Cocos nucifera TaxID=13894 RepID=A0A8K0NBG1_COCNU|nr:putative LRR receptor-like serine/threonine-protein kinase [Cocos nucifera]
MAVQALKVIASKLRKHWNFSVDPCSEDTSWLDPTSSKDVASSLTCECNTTSGVCHVTSIILKSQNLTGYLPEEFANLTFLSVLTLEDNQLQGPIPAALGNLVNLSRLLLSANNFSGDLLDSLGNLKNLEDLDMQGTSMEGPFPSTFGRLKSITELRVSDLKGGDGKFLPLQNMKNMKELVLRNLSISGQLPDFIGDMSKLKVLDLSFNNLTGPIPGSFNGLAKSINYMDVSYNSFTGSALTNCQQGNVNLVSSFSSTNSNSIASCLRRNLPCSGKAKNYNLFINCGGSKVTVDDHEYEDDSSLLGPSRYFESGSGKWAYSSTGDFVGNDKAEYVTRNASMLNMTNPELYTTARLNPLSLKYYGLCLQKGNYTVKLHFAEIMFTDNQTYPSVGERFFDVSIQGQKVLRDFNIAKEAKGTGKRIIKNFTTIVDGTLEIHFQWLGKGTNSIPQRGVYGPLISAISVTPNFKPDTGESKLSVGAVLGIVAGSCIVIMLILTLLWFCFRRKQAENSELRGLELQTGYFTIKQIKTATKNFDPGNKIGEGGFGSVYRGVLPDGSEIAVKQLSSKSKQGNREFINEIGMISALQHPNLVKLYGCCIEGNQLLLVYEYMENNSLAHALFGPQEYRLKLDWRTRRKICLGIARGLAFLHEESRLKIVHRDIKATNILLDKDLNAKISDFGLAKLDEEENSHISTRIAGTIGYMAPEYAMRGYLTDKADVYSFGVVALELVSGMSNTNYRPKEDFVYLLDWAYVLQEQGSLLELVDPNLGSNYPKEEALQMLNLALVCTNPSPTLRPTMSTVVSMLDGKTPVRVPEVKHSISRTEDIRFRSFERMFNESQSQSISGDGPWIDTSISAQSSKGSPSHSSTGKLLEDNTE